VVQGSVLSDIPPRDRIPRIEASMRQDPPKGGNAVVQAYILIQTEVGKSASVTEAVSGISGVAHAEDVTGPYDCIARVEAGTVDDLGKLVIAKIQEVPGITRTLTCTVVHV
jgi:DNA-binding Lrp family transcriptional regulator